MGRKQLFSCGYGQVRRTFIGRRQIPPADSCLRFDFIEIPTRLCQAEVVIGLNPVGKVDRNRPDSCMLHVMLDSMRVWCLFPLPVRPVPQFDRSPIRHSVNPLFFAVPEPESVASSQTLQPGARPE
jgi:hypothetical protein